jgi:hypothetical protein
MPIAKESETNVRGVSACPVRCAERIVLDFARAMDFASGGSVLEWITKT